MCWKEGREYVVTIAGKVLAKEERMSLRQGCMLLYSDLHHSGTNNVTTLLPYRGQDD
jgi:hypothetical protein